MLAFRTSFQTSLGCSPYEALFGLPPRTVLDLHFGSAPLSGFSVTDRIRRGVAEIYPVIRARIEGRQASWKLRHDRRVNSQPLSVGDSVALFCPQLRRGVSAKLQGKFSPGFRVIKVISEWDYLVSDGRFTSVVHRERLRFLPSRGPRLHLNPDVLRSFPCFSAPRLSNTSVDPRASEDGLRPYSSSACQPLRLEILGDARPDCVSCRTILPRSGPEVSLAGRPQRRRRPPDRLRYETLGGRTFPLERSSVPTP